MEVEVFECFNLKTVTAKISGRCRPRFGVRITRHSSGPVFQARPFLKRFIAKGNKSKVA